MILTVQWTRIKSHFLAAVANAEAGFLFTLIPTKSLSGNLCAASLLHSSIPKSLRCKVSTADRHKANNYGDNQAEEYQNFSLFINNQ